MTSRQKSELRAVWHVAIDTVATRERGVSYLCVQLGSLSVMAREA